MLFVSENPETLRSAVEEFEERLRKHMPSPEADLIRLSQAVALSPDTREWAEVRRLVIDIDDLAAQIRWHIAQAILLFYLYPKIADPRGDGPEIGHQAGIANSARLILREFITEADRVYFNSPLEDRWGGTAGGWIYQMLLDSSITRAVSMLDRIARTAALMGNVSFGNDKVYFRSGKLSVIHKALQRPETEALYKLSEQDYLKFLVDYRDGAAHRVQQFSRPLGFPPADSYLDEVGTRIFVRDSYRSAEDLLGIAMTGYTVNIKALPQLRSLAESMAPRVQGY